MAAYAQLKFVMTECSKTQIRLTRLKYEYSNDPMFLDRHVWANSVDPDQTEQSDQRLHRLPFRLHPF